MSTRIITVLVISIRWKLTRVGAPKGNFAVRFLQARRISTWHCRRLNLSGVETRNPTVTGHISTGKLMPLRRGDTVGGLFRGVSYDDAGILGSGKLEPE